MRYRILINGLVQGIGFRPFVAELAEELQLTGQVKNLGGIVEIIVSGEQQAVDNFIQRLNFVEKNGELPGCRIDGMQVEELTEKAFDNRMQSEEWSGKSGNEKKPDEWSGKSGNEKKPDEWSEKSSQKLESDEQFEDNDSQISMEKSVKKAIFRIADSGSSREMRRFLPVDMPTCDRCVAEMQDSSNRRYRYPFISCTACGPRFSIQKAVPYDRETITMENFPMCGNCRREYTQKGNIRRHAQTIACKDCGPRLRYVAYYGADDESEADVGRAFLGGKSEEDYHGIRIESEADLRSFFFEEESGRTDCMLAQKNASVYVSPPLKAVFWKEITHEQQAIAQAIQDLKNGKIGAIKDIGGYHFAFSPLLSEPAKRLREFKNRDKKPFAVMFLNIDSVKEYCEVSKKEEEILLSSPRPIVLLKKKKDFVAEICGDSDRIGAILPCNPLQILLLEETGPLVMTSGNRGGEPIIISEEEVLSHIGNGIDFMLTHDREILTPLDDSIYQVAEVLVDRRTDEAEAVVNEQIVEIDKQVITNEDIAKTVTVAVETHVQLIRRARGLVPEPIILKRKLLKDTFAAGGDLKAVFALGREELVYLSQYFGDLEDVRCMESRQKAIQHMEQLLEIQPEVTVGDLHPAYISTQGMDMKIQHHHAHAASVIAEHGLEGKVLGIVCDGTGFGTDGTIWGSEFLLCEEERMTRKGHFLPVKLAGGDAGAKQADRTLFSYMLSAREHGLEVNAFFQECVKKDQEAGGQNFRLQEMAWKQNINTAYSSSMGRLFDAAAAVLDICHANSYEGECAILLEQMAHKGKNFLQETDDLKWKNCLQVECVKIDGRWQPDGAKLLVELYHLKQTYSKELLAYLFHHAIAEAIVETALHICEENDVVQIALSGGTFINRILLGEVMSGLRRNGKEVYINEKVPCGDGGIALGQIYLMRYGHKF